MEKNYDVQLLSEENFSKEELERFFHDYHFEDFYYKSLAILSRTSFIDFLIDKIYRRLKKKHGNLWFLRNNNCELVAIFGLEKDSNLSAHYNKNIYNIVSYYNFKDRNGEVFRVIMNVINQQILICDIEYIRCKIDMSDHDNIHFLTQADFDYYASGKRNYLHAEQIPYPATHYENYEVIDYREEVHFEGCIALLKQHRLNEKYYNRRFSQNQTESIFIDWFKAQTNNRDTTVLICEDIDTHKVVGVLMFTKSRIWKEKLNKRIITWDLVIIDEKERGKHLASYMFEEMVRRSPCDIEASTMVDNLSIQKKVKELGFTDVRIFVYLGKEIG